MIDVKRPVLLNASLQPVRTLNASALKLTFNSPGVSQAEMTLPPDETEPDMHAWCNLYNQNGFAGCFWVTTPTTNIWEQHQITLRHGIDVLSASVLEEQDEFSGTVAQLLTKIINAQKQKIGNTAFWQLGDCEDTHTLKYSLNYDKLSDLLAKIEADETDYMFFYDQTSFPWTLHFRAKPSGAACEFRQNRAVHTISLTRNDNDLCTQLILSVNTQVTTGTGDDASTETVTQIKTYNNAAAQAIWGIVQKTADIDTNDDLTQSSWPEADAWAARFLAEHAEPLTQAQFTGKELKAQTGDDWDEAKLGYLCRVPLPQKNETILERAVTVEYPDALGDPSGVTVSLANNLPKFSSGIANMRKQSAETAASARASARAVVGAAKEKELKTWSMVVKDQKLALDGTGITELYESGISMDAQGGVMIYNLAQGLQSLYSGIEVQAGRINLVVQGEGTSASINISAIVDGINNAGSSVTISGDKIYLQGETLTTYLQTDYLDAIQAFIEDAEFTQIYAETISATTVGASSDMYIDGISLMDNTVASIGPASASGGQITIPWTKFSGAAGTPVNFNIADTQFYQDGVSAAYERGKAEGSGTHNITIRADERFDTKPDWATEIFEDAGDYEDLRDKKTGYYVFKVTCGTAEKWYCFHVGNS